MPREESEARWRDEAGAEGSRVHVVSAEAAVEGKSERKEVRG